MTNSQAHPSGQENSGASSHKSALCSSQDLMNGMIQFWLCQVPSHAVFENINLGRWNLWVDGPACLTVLMHASGPKQPSPHLMKLSAWWQPVGYKGSHSIHLLNPNLLNSFPGTFADPTVISHFSLAHVVDGDHSGDVHWLPCSTSGTINCISLTHNLRWFSASCTMLCRDLWAEVFSADPNDVEGLWFLGCQCKTVT